MKKEKRNYFILALCMLIAFLLWTVALHFVDVRPIGPQGTSVGFASLNSLVHSLTGAHMLLYTVTDWLSIIPLVLAMGFGILGLFQWVCRKHILKVDHSILVLGGFYILVMIAYILFEVVVVNYRPVLINGYLEASYPSSTTMLVMCIMPTASMQFNRLIKNIALKRTVTLTIVVFTAFMVIGRLLSGVHWITDIIGGLLLSTALLSLYVGAE